MTYITLIGALFLTFLIIGFVKADLHLDYLKSIKPNEYSAYPKYISVFSFNNLNVRLQFLILPFFEREEDLEDYKSGELARNVRKLVRYQLISLASIVLVVTFIILNF